MKKLTRKQIVEGVATAIELMGLTDPDISMEELIVFYGEDDNITKKEAVAYLGVKELAA
jgi:hypothetical protein